MVKFGEKAKMKEGGNLNWGRSYVITTVPLSFLLFTFAFQWVGCDYWNCIFEACLILLYFESLNFHKCIYSTNYCVHLLSNYIFIHICITAFQWVWVELLEPYYWSMFPIVVAKLAQQMKGGFHLQLLVIPFVYQL